MVRLANGLAGRGFRVDLVLVRQKGAWLDLVAPGVRLEDLRAGRTILSLPGLIRYLRRRSPEVLLSTTDLPNLLALAAKSVAGVRTRVVARVGHTASQLTGFPSGRSRWWRLLQAHLFRRADGMVANSQGVAQDWAAYAGVPLERIRCIYNPTLPPDLPALSREPAGHPWFGPGWPPVVLGLGSLTPYKDFATLIRAFHLVRRKAEARLVILGQGWLRPRLEALVQELGLAGEVSLPGFVANPYPFLGRAAVFVLSSKTEGLPNALIQALACGCRVVSTNCPSGPAEILDQGRYGRLVPVARPREMAEAILTSLAGPPPPIPDSWLDRFRVETVLDQYVQALGLESWSGTGEGR